MKKLLLVSLVGLAICLLAMPAMADTQKLLNGGFENWSINGVNGPPDHWGYRTAYPTVTADSTTVRTGNYSARYYWNTTTTTKLYSDTIAVTPGAVYTCTLWVNDSDTSGRARPWFWFAPNGIKPTPSIPYSSNVAGWEALIWEATCPAGSYWLNMEIRGNSEGSARWDGDAVVYVDDFVLWEAVPTTNQPPVISSVLRYPYPLVPENATVTSRATITDDYNIVTDSLYRRIVPGAFAPVYHDSVVGSYYWYTLGSYSIDDSVEYYVIARDDSSARTASSTYGFTCVDTNAPVIPIAQVQFNNTNPGGTAPDTCYPSPLLGNLVKLTGKVTAVYQQSGRHGWFWLQDADSVWSGVYVYGGTTGDTVQIGDSITVNVSVAEYYGLTEMMSPTGMVKHAAGRPLPPPLQITSATLGSTGCSPVREQYEGMYAELHNFTVTSYQGSPLYAYWGNDGSGDSCAIWTTIYNNGYDMPTITVGQTYSSIKGVVNYTRGQYVLGPRVSADVVLGNAPPSITNVLVYPSPMVPGQVVTLHATKTSSSGTIVSDSLYYALNAGAFTAVTHDSIATGNVYKFHMGSYAIGDSVSYYVVATDNIAQRTQTSTAFFVVPDTSFCGADTIYNIEYTLNQGSDSSCFISPYEGQIVNICGIVTAVQQGATKYFYLQHPRTSAG